MSPPRAAERGAGSASTGDRPSPPARKAAVPAQVVELGGSFIGMLPTGITSFGAQAIDGDVVLLGGYSGTPHQYSREGQSDAVLRIDGSDGSISELPSLAEGVQGVAMVAHGGAIYRIGGLIAENDASEPSKLRSSAKFARLDLGSGQWKALADLPQGRSSHDATVIGDTVYVVGGWALTPGEEAKWQDQILAFDLDAAHGEAARWRSIDAPFEARALAAAQAGATLVVVGGMNAENEITRAVHLFDTARGEWRRGPDYPGDPFGVAATSVDGLAYASGRDGTVYRLDLGASRWVPVGRLVLPRFFHRLVAISPKRLIAIGGITEMTTKGRAAVIEALDLDQAAVPRVSWALIGNPGESKNRAGTFVHESSVYFFGGNNSLGQHDFAPENFVREGHALYLPSLSFSSAAPFPVARQSMVTVVDDEGGRVFFAGGFGHDGETARAHDDIFVYDIAHDSFGRWACSLPEPRTQFGFVQHRERLLVIGGLDYDDRRSAGDQFRHLASVMAAPVPESKEGVVELPCPEPFEPLEKGLPSPRRAFATALLGEHVYVAGGMKENFAPVDEFGRFHVSSGRWESLPKPAKTRISGELVPIDGKLYLVGGSTRTEEGLETERTIEVYDPETKRWSVVIDELPFDTRHLRAAPYRGQLLLVVPGEREGSAIRIALVTLGKPKPTE